LNHSAADCMARRKTHMVKVAGAEVKRLGTRTSFKTSGNKRVNSRRMALQLTEKVLCKIF